MFTVGLLWHKDFHRVDELDFIFIKCCFYIVLYKLCYFAHLFKYIYVSLVFLLIKGTFSCNTIVNLYKNRQHNVSVILMYLYMYFGLDFT